VWTGSSCNCGNACDNEQEWVRAVVGSGKFVDYTPKDVYNGRGDTKFSQIKGWVYTKYTEIIRITAEA